MMEKTGDMDVSKNQHVEEKLPAFPTYTLYTLNTPNTFDTLDTHWTVESFKCFNETLDLKLFHESLAHSLTHTYYS